MRTRFFQDMVNEEKRNKGEYEMNDTQDTEKVWTQCYLVPHPRTLYLEQVVGEEKAAEVFNTYPDDQNPLKSGKVYRAMLRDQYLTMARLRAGQP